MTTLSLEPRTPIPTGLVLAVAAWAAAVVLASSSGALGVMAGVFMPAYAALVALGIAVPTALYFSSPALRRAVDAVGPRRLTFFHL